MNKAIENRACKIRRGVVPRGYKKTKVAIVPCEWEETRFKTMFSRLLRKNAENNGNVLTISAQDGLIRQQDFFNKSVASDDKSGYYLLYQGEFAYNKSYSNGYPYGALKRLELYDRGIVSPLYICFRPTEKNACPAFYTQYFEAGMMNREIQAFAQEGARNHGLLNIAVSDFFNSRLLVPPVPEQEKIADILSAQDRVIKLKEMRIALKRDFKKHLMRRLLTGEQRLPGCSGTWRRIKLSRLLKERKSYAAKGSAYPHVTLSTQGICGKTQRYDREHLVKSLDKQYKITKKGDICYNPANLKFGVLCVNHYGDAIFSPIYVTFETTALANLEFLGYYMMRWDFINAVRKYEEGTVYERMAVKPQDLLKYEIPLPPPEEQAAIAQVLSTADREIELLQKDLEQEKRKKTALTQLLLTGIVRVKP